jgi:hypothetical protein
VNLFLNEGQDAALVRQSYERATTILTTDEKIEYVATATRAGLTHAPDCVVATNKRVILFRKKVLGKYDLDDCQWRDVRATHMAEGKNGITFTVDAIQGWHLIVEALPRAQAERIHDIAMQHCERLGGSSSKAQATSTVQATPAASSAQAVTSAPVVASSAPAALPIASVPPTPTAWPVAAVQALQAESGAATQVPASAMSNISPASSEPPTPESVLQSILQSQGITDGGAPTRPMQFSAAAFQAPAMADAQPVSIRDTDTEPHMRPIPPLTTLEQIAVFSGPLAFDQIPTHDISAPLNQYPLSATKPGSGPLPGLSAHASGGLSPSALRSSAPLRPADAPGSGPLSSSTSGPTSGSLPDYLLDVIPEASANGSATRSSAPLHSGGLTEAETEQQRDRLDTLVAMSDMMSNIVPVPVTDTEGGMPVPGSTSSGPLLEASLGEGALTEGLDSSLNSGGLPTQRLYMESPLDMDSDRPTDINLGDYGVSGPLSSKNGKNGPAKGSPRAAGVAGPSRSGQSKNNPDDPINKMKQLKMLLDSGFITQDDYEAKKADILARFF